MQRQNKTRGIACIHPFKTQVIYIEPSAVLT
jgi:hypothetical protein